MHSWIALNGMHLLVILLSLWPPINCLLLPNNSLLQIVGGLSVPVSDLPKTYRLFIDWGFQMNYDLPFQVESFYNIPIFPNLFGNMNRVGKRSYDLASEFEDSDGATEFRWNYSSREVYRFIELLLEGHGFDKSCLVRAICELALHPFANDDDEGDFLTDVLTVLLKPSLHSDWSSSQNSPYHDAEVLGSQGYKCEHLYLDCHYNLFDFFTIIQFS